MMYPIDLPDALWIRNLSATGYPDGNEPQTPHCPICGNVCETVYYNIRGGIVGCDSCISETDARNEPECFF